MFQACTSQTWTKCGSSLVIQSANWAISKNLSSSCKSLARIQRALEINPRKPPRATVVKARTGGAFSSGWTRVKPSSARSRFKAFCRNELPVSSATASASNRIFFMRALMSLRSLSGGQLAPSENDYPQQGKSAPEKQDDLAKRGGYLHPGNASAGTQ